MFKVLIVASREDAGVSMQIVEFADKRDAEACIISVDDADTNFYNHTVKAIRLYKE